MDGSPLQALKEVYREIWTPPEQMREPYTSRMRRWIDVAKLGGSVLLGDLISMSANVVLEVVHEEAPVLGYMQTSEAVIGVFIGTLGVMGMMRTDGQFKRVEEKRKERLSR